MFKELYEIWTPAILSLISLLMSIMAMYYYWKDNYEKATFYFVLAIWMSK